tara:strand:+ start:520 stop:1269 length:750 start_codon:yes stop_codon:yes gene_type:complete
MNRKIAFFIDGGYFKRRVTYFHRTFFDVDNFPLTPEALQSVLYRLVSKHKQDLERTDTYRIYYYDAPPFDGQYREPVPQNLDETCRTRNFKREPSVEFQKSFHSKLLSSRKLALRMGKLANHKRWILNEEAQKKLIKGDIDVTNLSPNDFYLDVKQKGVDTRLGIDITTVTLRKFADTIVLMASDADFVPAAKLARTHGMDVVLDPLYGNVDQDLECHVDGKRSYDIVSILKDTLQCEPNQRPNWWNRE